MSPAVMTFQNYLKNSFRPEEDFTVDSLQSFLNLTLEYPHWQQNSREMTTSLQSVLNLREFANVKWPQELQIFEIQSAADQVETALHFLKRTHKNTDQVRVLFDSHQNRTVGLVLADNETLSIRTFGNKFVIRGGFLEPLRTDLTLKYDSNLELLQRVPQMIEVAPYTSARFVVDDALVFGSLIRGYIFQKSMEFKGQSLEKYPKLFFALKRVEQFFVRRESDPYYKEMIQNLESSILNIKMVASVNHQMALDALARAQSAFENVFVDDKLLPLLIRDLQILLEGKSLKAADLERAENHKSWPKPLFDLTN